MYQTTLDRWTPYMRWRWIGALTLLLLFGLRVVLMQVFIFNVVLVVPRSGGQDRALEKSTLVRGSRSPYTVHGAGALRTGTAAFVTHSRIFVCLFECASLLATAVANCDVNYVLFFRDGI